MRTNAKVISLVLLVLALLVAAVVTAAPDGTPGVVSYLLLGVLAVIGNRVFFG